MSALVASDEGQSPAPQAQLRQKSMEANGALAKKEAVKSVKAGTFPAELFKKKEPVEEAAVRGAAMGAEDMEVDVEVEVEGGGEPERSKKSGEEIFAMYSVGQKLRVDAVKKANQGRTAIGFLSQFSLQN